MMGDKKALQSGTSHNLGQNFARAFNIQYLDKANQLQLCWTTSWGLSTRMVGAIVMTHGDDQGLVLPPKLAPYQAVIVPIWRKEQEQVLVTESAIALERELKAEICALYPDEWVCLVAIEGQNETDFEFTTARVAGHGKTRKEPLVQARPARAQYGAVGHYYTGRIVAPVDRRDWFPTRE